MGWNNKGCWITFFGVSDLEIHEPNVRIWTLATSLPNSRGQKQHWEDRKAKGSRCHSTSWEPGTRAGAHSGVQVGLVLSLVPLWSEWHEYAGSVNESIPAHACACVYSNTYSCLEPVSHLCRGQNLGKTSEKPRTYLEENEELMFGVGVQHRN